MRLFLLNSHSSETKKTYGGRRVCFSALEAKINTLVSAVGGYLKHIFTTPGQHRHNISTFVEVFETGTTWGLQLYPFQSDCNFPSYKGSMLSEETINR